MNDLFRSKAVPGRTAWLNEDLPPLKVSFEIFPARTPEQEANLWTALDRLAPLAPDYVSVTCGAGGNYASNTAETVEAVQNRLGLPAVPHLTAVSADRLGIETVARVYLEKGVNRIVALRGDPPVDFDRPADSHLYASDLVAALSAAGDFRIAVAGYPEPHPEAPSEEADFDNLRRKVDAGAAEIITQYCFETDKILRFRDAVASAGIEANLVAGIMPINSFVQISKFSARCGASMPDWLCRLFDGLQDDPQTARSVAAMVCAEQCRRLAVEGLTELHFYTLNRSKLTLAVARLLGLHERVLKAA